MLSLTNPFRWHIWPSLWDFIFYFIRRINLFEYQLSETAKPTLDEDVESGGTETQFQHVIELIMLIMLIMHPTNVII